MKTIFSFKNRGPILSIYLITSFQFRSSSKTGMILEALILSVLGALSYLALAANLRVGIIVHFINKLC